MRLPWRKPKAGVSAEHLEEARAARAEARANLVEARERGSEVRELVAQLRELRQHNHFAEGLRAMLREDGTGHAPHAR